jgi:hypothetical protein
MGEQFSGVCLRKLMIRKVEDGGQGRGWKARGEEGMMERRKKKRVGELNAV